MCTKKGFLSKLRLSEHEKRKHPTVVVTSVVNGGNSATASPTSSSHNQSEVLQTTEAQPNTHQLVTPMTCRPANTASSAPSSNISSYSSANVNSAILPDLSSSVPSTHKHCETNSYFNYTSPMNQHPLMPSSYQMPQQQSYVGSHHLNNYPPYGNHPSTPTSGNPCHIQSTSSYQQPLSTSSGINHQQQYLAPLPPMSSDSVINIGHNEEENVGSLLRLVYSCSDNNMDSNYNINTHNFPEGQTNSSFMVHPHSIKPASGLQQHQHISHHQPANLNNACVMPDYTALDSELSRGSCFDWDSFTKIDCKN